MKTASLTLKNGLKVFIYSSPQLESVCIAAGVKCGLIDDDVKLGGTTHYLEHMLFKGTKRRSAKDIRTEVMMIGAEQNAATDMEATIYYIYAYKEYFGKMMDLISDMIKNSVLEKKEFELERGPVLNERLGREDNTYYFLYDNFTSVLFKRHPAGTVKETEASIKRIKLNDIAKIYREYYCPENIVLTICGNVSISKAKQLSKRYFGDFHKKFVPRQRQIANEPQVRNEVVISKKNIKHAIIGIGFKCGEFSKHRITEFVSLSIIEQILYERLFDEIREKRGLSYDPTANCRSSSTFGFIAAQAGVEPDKINETKRLIMKELQKLEEGKITRKEVDRAKRVVISEYKLMKEDTIKMAYNSALDAMVTGNYRFVEQMPERVAKIGMNDIVACCKKYIKTKSYGLLILKPEK